MAECCIVAWRLSKSAQPELDRRSTASTAARAAAQLGTFAVCLAFFPPSRGQKAAPPQSGTRQSTEFGPWPLKLGIGIGIANANWRRVSMRERQSGQVPVEVQNETNALQLDRSLDLDKKNGLASLRSLQLSQRNGVNAGCSYAHLYAPTLVVILAHRPVRPTRQRSGHHEVAEGGAHFRWASLLRQQPRQGPAAIDARYVAAFSFQLSRPR
jgi:hypothetical protein